MLYANDTTLPAGWRAPGGTLACATTRTGNGCELSLAYAATPSIANTLTLNFGYTNNSGVARTGNVNIFYLDDRWLDRQQSRRLYLHIGHPFGHYFGPKPAQEFYTGGGWADFGARNTSSKRG